MLLRHHNTFKSVTKPWNMALWQFKKCHKDVRPWNKSKLYAYGAIQSRRNEANMRRGAGTWRVGMGMRRAARARFSAEQKCGVAEEKLNVAVRKCGAGERTREVAVRNVPLLLLPQLLFKWKFSMFSARLNWNKLKLLQFTGYYRGIFLFKIIEKRDFPFEHNQISVINQSKNRIFFKNLTIFHHILSFIINALWLGAAIYVLYIAVYASKYFFSAYVYIFCVPTLKLYILKQEIFKNMRISFRTFKSTWQSSFSELFKFNSS